MSVTSTCDGWSFSSHLVTMWRSHWLCSISGPFAESQLSYCLSHLSWGSLLQAAGSILTDKVGSTHHPPASWRSRGEEEQRQGRIFLPFLFQCLLLIRVRFPLKHRYSSCLDPKRLNPVTLLGPAVLWGIGKGKQAWLMSDLGQTGPESNDWPVASLGQGSHRRTETKSGQDLK